MPDKVTLAEKLVDANLHSELIRSRDQTRDTCPQIGHELDAAMAAEVRQLAAGALEQLLGLDCRAFALQHGNVGVIAMQRHEAVERQVDRQIEWIVLHRHRAV